MLVCPKSRLTVSMGTPLDNSTVVAAGYVLLHMIGQVDFYTAQLGNGFQLLVASRVTRHGNTLLCLVIPCTSLLSFREHPTIGYWIPC